MTIPESVQLIIRAGSLSEDSGEVLRARDGRADQDHRPGRDDDPPVGPRARARHRDRDRRRAPRGEVPRGSVQPVRAPAAHAGPADPPRAAGAARPAWVEQTSPTSTCWCSRETLQRLAEHVAKLSGTRLPSGETWRPACHRRLAAAHGDDPFRHICPPLHLLGGRRRWLCLDYRPGHSRAAVFLAGPRDREPARAGRTRPTQRVSTARGQADHDGPPAAAGCRRSGTAPAAAQPAAAARTGNQAAAARRRRNPFAAPALVGRHGCGPGAAGRSRGAGAERRDQADPDRSGRV